MNFQTGESNLEKLHIDKLIVVEGKYDKIKLSNVTDAPVFVINGFGIFKDRKMRNSLKVLAGKKDVIILTDSDTAGYKIRVYLSKILSGNNIINAFVPRVTGKEKRKSVASAENILGIEGVDNEILYNVLRQYLSDREKRNDIKLVHLYDLGYIGVPGSKEKRNRLLEHIGVQINISNNFLLNILNERYSYNEFVLIDKTLNKEVQKDV